MGTSTKPPALKRLPQFRTKSVTACTPGTTRVLVSDFRPVSFEMPIQEDGEGKASLHSAFPTMAVLKIIGEIDRSDAYQKDGKPIYGLWIINPLEVEKSSRISDL